MSVMKLSGLKRVYVNYVIELLSFTSNEPILQDYAKQFIDLLKYTINVHNNLVLNELSENLESIIVVYIFDLSELLNNQVRFDTNKEKCGVMSRYKNLVIANNAVKDLLANYDEYGDCDLQELDNVKQILLQL